MERLGVSVRPGYRWKARCELSRSLKVPCEVSGVEQQLVNTGSSLVCVIYIVYSPIHPARRRRGVGRGATAFLRDVRSRSPVTDGSFAASIGVAAGR